MVIVVNASPPLSLAEFTFLGRAALFETKDANVAFRHFNDFNTRHSPTPKHTNCKGNEEEEKDIHRVTLWTLISSGGVSLC